jgi:hypothetical protein
MVQNTVKISFFVANWPFMTTTNELVISLASNPDRPITNCDVASRSDASDNLLWFTVQVDGKTLYARIIEVLALFVLFYFILFCFVEIFNNIYTLKLIYNVSFPLLLLP